MVWEGAPKIPQGQKVKLFLDDLRDPPSNEWVVARTAHQAQYILEAQRDGGYLVTSLSLDHDLGADEMGSGYDVATWLEGAVVTGHLPAPIDILCHSANPVGRARIEQAFESIRRRSIR